jgi:GTP-binding protein
MIIKSATFTVSATRPSNYPPEDLPEIAFAGRSNVGKSTLINKLVNRKHLVKTSSTPGRTQLLNFFTINDAFVFVDLPGYGYARVPERVKKDWGKMIDTYLSTRSTLKGVVLILDIRRTPQDEERNFLAWIHQKGITAILVLTKADKLSKTKQKKQVQEIEKSLALHPDELICFSAKTGQGLAAVWQAIGYCIGQTDQAEDSR